MEKLELKHIVGYLPYKLECIASSDLNLRTDVDEIEMQDLKGSKIIIDYISETICGYNKEYYDFKTTGWFDDKILESIKPILRPLSDLTKEIEVNGEKFVPIEIIGKTIDDRYTNLHEDDNGSVVGFSNRLTCYCPNLDCDCHNGDTDYILKYSEELKYFYAEISMDADYDNIVGQEDYPSYYLIQKLYEWHFDLNDLIGKGLAIDANTIKTN